jgi:hypothetical protein
MEISLRIEGNEDGSVSVMSGDFYLITIYKDGSIKRGQNLPEELGFKLDGTGRIEIENP